MQDFRYIASCGCVAVYSAAERYRSMTVELCPRHPKLTALRRELLLELGGRALADWIHADGPQMELGPELSAYRVPPAATLPPGVCCETLL